MAQAIIDLSGKKGLADRSLLAYSEDRQDKNFNIIAVPDGFLVEGAHNPEVMPGYLCPATGTIETATGATLSNPITAIVEDPYNSGNVYVANNSYIYRVSNVTGSTAPTITQQVALSGVTAVYNMTFSTVNGVRKLMVVFEDTSGYVDIAYVAVDSSGTTGSLTDNWLTATITGHFTNTLGAAAHPFMILADNGFAYLYQDNNIHKIDGSINGGTVGTVTPNVIQFPTTRQIVDAVDHAGRQYIVVSETAARDTSGYSTVETHNIGIYIWDRRTTDYSDSVYISVAGLNAVRRIYVTTQGKIRVIGIDTNGYLSIMQLDGAGFTTVYRGPKYTLSEYRDSVYVAKDSVSILSSDGRGFYTHRDVYSGSDVFYAPLRYTSGNRHNVMLLREGTSRQYFIGGKDYVSKALLTPTSPYTGSHYEVSVWDREMYFPPITLPPQSTLQDITIYCANQSTHADDDTKEDFGYIRVYLNGSSNAYTSYTITRSDVMDGVIRIPNGKTGVHSVQLSIQYDGGAINYIGFFPSYAIVEYTPTNARNNK